MQFLNTSIAVTTSYLGDIARKTRNGIEPYHEYLNQFCKDKTGNSLNDIAATVYDVAVSVIRGSLIGLVFLSNSSLFVLGFVASVLKPHMMKGANERIIATWNNQDIGTKVLVVAAGLFAWPITLAVTAIFLGGHIGVKLQSDAPTQT